MYRGNDNVFRVSLIGIAFILIFFLLIVFSRVYTDADVARRNAEDRLSQRQQESTLPAAQQEAFDFARQELHLRLSEGGANADEVIRGLLDKTKIEAELVNEKKRVQDLGVQLTGFTEIRKILTQASRTPVLSGTSSEALVSALELRTRLEQEFSPDQNASKLTDREIVSRALAAINFRRNIETLVERELGMPLVPGQESSWEQWLVSDSQSFKSMLDKPTTTSDLPTADSSTLRAQIAFLRKRLESHGDKVTPPCWFDSAGRVQFLLAIEIRPGRSETVIAKPAWLPTREAAAQAIPGVKPMLARPQMSYDTFKGNARTIAQSAKQCRYSVQVVDNLRSGMRSEKIHQELEVFFDVVVMPR
ncbi:MAG: hypothetical protein LBV29_06615 [Azoarcus sp.]|jgi:hypothetical protein|nr:hypothetical protein [Azoarcus sp.]